ncbi:hypothetical protein GCM10017589_02590 [Streptomyces poonensis]|nr:hypothetical protein GCM10017589_02590 [Streptomyces poonensis]
MTDLRDWWSVFLRASPPVVHRSGGGWWPECGKAVRILGMGDVSRALPDG